MKDNISIEVSTFQEAAKILQREYLHVKQAFTGSFSTSWEAEFIPLTLKSFLLMLFDGPGVDEPPPGSEKSKVVTCIRQQMIFNSAGRRSKKPGSISRYIKDKETPASLYVAMKVHFQTGHETLIDNMHRRGLHNILYDRWKCWVQTSHIQLLLTGRRWVWLCPLKLS